VPILAKTTTEIIMSDEYKLMRICEGELDFELLIFGTGAEPNYYN
jgi:hypothetical protein